MSLFHKYKLAGLCIACSLLLYANFCRSQDDLQFEHFTSENGLSENFVYSIYQDKKGFLWIGTHDGLNRYDGYGFKKFRHDPADKNSLPDNTIYSITGDREGNIWMGTNSGLIKLDPVSGIFNTINLQGKLKRVEQIVSVANDELLLRHEGNLCLLSTRTQKEIPVYSRHSNSPSLLTHSNSPIVKNKAGDVFIASIYQKNAQLLKFNGNNKCFAPFVKLALPVAARPYPTGYFYIDGNNRCWLPVSHEETFIFNLDTSSVQSTPIRPSFVLNTNAIRHIFEDNDDNIWLATSSGLIYYDHPTAKAHWQKQANNSSFSISSNDAQQTFQDLTGLIWVATSNGLNKLNPLQKKFKHLRWEGNSKNGLYNNFVLGVYPEAGDQLRIHYNIFDKRHFSRYDFRKHRFDHFLLNDYSSANWVKDVVVQNPERLTPLLLKTILQAFGKNESYTGTVDFPRQIWIDRQQFLWDDLGVLPNDSAGKKWIAEVRSVLMKLWGNNLWIASTKGLIDFNTVTKTTVTYHTGSNGSNSISSNDITCFLFAPDGNMWIATKGGGLNFFDRTKNSFQHFTEKDGLCNNSIYCMVMDDKGRLWLGTSYGLSNFDPATRQFQNFYKSDGLINNEYNRYSACKMPDGTVFMGGMNGIDFFHPDSLLINENKPEIQITDFKLYNQSIYPGRISSLQHDQNFITIEFAAMDFNNPAANKFAYKLEGADKDWVVLEGRNFATYSHLLPGSYRFLVKAANSRGVWNDEPKVFQFTIMPAWYRTWWFYSLCAIAIASIIYLLFRYRLQQKLKVLQVRNRLHRDLHDDVGATLSSVRVYSEILGKNGNSEIISGLIKKNADDMIDKLEVISWATNPQYDNFKSLVDAMLKFARPLTHANNIELQFEKSGFEDEVMIPGDVRQNILLIFKEAINNMVKYAEAGKCKVSLVVRNQKLMLEVKDNGQGYDGMIKGGGEGFKNMRKRAEEMNGTIEIKTAEQQGTVIYLAIPYPFKIPRTWYQKKTIN